MQLSDLDVSKTYTYADYLKWTFDERLELIKGKIFKMSPAPGSVHQLISGAIFAELYNYLKGKPCKVFHAPFDVRLNKCSINNKDIQTVVQPDISVVCNPLKIDEKGCLGAPDIVVEILSPGNNKKELQNKYEYTKKTGYLNTGSFIHQRKLFSDTASLKTGIRPRVYLLQGMRLSHRYYQVLY
jgi:Uma2 family endonuclease